MADTSGIQLRRILPLDSDQVEFRLVGGKGANLSRLIRAGFPVPAGFVITTDAYLEYVAVNNLEVKIQGYLDLIVPGDPQTLETASKQIREAFQRGAFPTQLAGEIEQVYRDFSAETSAGRAVAVRSSATTEDLPEMSFAGQQDTFLNVVGLENLLDAVVKCWSSLWTARAIGYRARNNTRHTDAALAIVVQDMVQSVASGVLFTANPLTGLRSEIVIDATFGLGEALVSGQVEPDHYTVDTATGQIRSKTLGAKEFSVHGLPDGGTTSANQPRRNEQALPDESILELSRLGSQVVDLFGVPQDIEWAWTGSQMILLQARPVTTLFPTPAGMPSRPLKVFLSFASIQGIMDPITPLGRDAIREFFAAGAKLFGFKVTRQTQNAIFAAGGRLWVNFAPVLSNSVGRRIFKNVYRFIEPAAGQAIETVLQDPDLIPKREGISLQGGARLARFFVPLVFNVLLNLASPRRRREAIIARGEKALEMVEARSSAIQGDSWQRLEQQIDLLPYFTAEYFPRLFVKFVSLVAAGMASWNFLHILTEGTIIGEETSSSALASDLVMKVTRGMPYNPTTEMDLALWEMAKKIKGDADSLCLFAETPAEDLSERYLSGSLPPLTMKLVSQFLQRYGGRGFSEIDLGRTRWAEDPTHVFEMLTSFTKITDVGNAPDVVFARGADSAQEAIKELEVVVRQTQHGWLKARLVRFFASRARQIMGARESPKFFVVRLLWIARRELLKTGRELTAAGELDQPDDLFFLTLSELRALPSREEADWRSLIRQRRSDYQREMLRRQIPRVLISDGRAFYEGVSADENSKDALVGSPVSPGSVEGRVRVVFDPTRAGLLPGEILVCKGTDPSWTPLFLSAGGLVMEMGGMMTHGAVVAREYGIPAIVGVDQATSRFSTGQMICINGSTGQIFLVDELAASIDRT